MMRCECPTRPSVKNGNPKVSQLHPLERDGSSVRGNALRPTLTIYFPSLGFFSDSAMKSSITVGGTAPT